MFFDSYGPFTVPRNNGLISPKLKPFWNEVRVTVSEYDYDERELERAFGCYVYALMNGDKYKPWYVGMTLAEDGFKSEIFQPHKINVYNRILHSKRGIPVIFLFPL